MYYKKFQDISLSALGFGCMRLPAAGDGDSCIDEDMVETMVKYAMEHGINYFDTAWGYHGGNSETVIGKTLKKYPRDSFYLATKFPGYDLANMGRVKEIFERQLEKCQVDYFDFYLCHNVSEKNIDSYMDPQNQVVEFLVEQRKIGRIRHLGFSAHGDLPVLKRFLEVYGSQMEFCQIQLNYLDWIFQHAEEKVSLLAEYNLPIWVMEPLRGGNLVRLEPEDSLRLKELRPEESIPGWAFRFLQGIDQVVMILSGMTEFDQLKQNIKIFEDIKPLNDEEKAVLLSIAEEMLIKANVPCTACRYCISKCPKGLDIPKLIALYNEHRSEKPGWRFIAPTVLASMPENKHPSACIACHNCEKVCPQGIHIPEELAAFNQLL